MRRLPHVRPVETFLAEPAVDLLSIAGPHGSSVFVVPLRREASAGVTEEWHVGPLPVVQAVNETASQRRHARITDSGARRTLVARQQADVLYGVTGFRRYWKAVEFDPSDEADFALVALEIFVGVEEDPTTAEVGFAVVHAVAQAEDLDGHVDASARTSYGVGPSGTGLWARVAAELPDRSRLAPDAKVRTLTYAGVDDLPGSVVDPLQVAYAFVAGISALSDDTASRSAHHALTIERPDWSCLALRDGAAFVAHQTSGERFADVLRVLVHTVHVDGLLLALTQRVLVDRIGEQAVEASLDAPTDLVALERTHFDFRRSYWRTCLTDKRSAPPDLVFRALQHELLTGDDVAEVQQRIEDGARLATSLHAEAQGRSHRRLNRTVQSATAVIGAFGLSFAAAPVLSEPSAALFAAALGFGSLATAAAFGALAVVRRHSERAEGGPSI